MSLQHSHTSTPFIQHRFPITIICDGIQSPANIGSLFRIADAFGVAHIIFGNATVDLQSARLRRTSRNTHTNTPYTEVTHLEQEVLNLKKQDYTIIALEITAESIPLEKFQPAKDQHIALILGNERKGISDSLLAMCDHQLHINMHGKNSSMNVIQAAAIALYALTKH